MKNYSADFSDEDLMALYQKGEVAAFETLYQRHGGRVFEFLQKKTSVQNAAELTQEIFLKLHRFRHQYSVQYPFLPWLFTIARNTFLDFVRLNETKVAHRSVDAAPPEAAVTASWTGDLSESLKLLPSQQRRAIELRYLSDWSFEQIAGEMKTSPANIRQMISRAVRKIRSSFGGSDE